MEPVITLELPASKVQLIINALAARPFGEVNELIGSIVEQGRRQLPEQQPAETEEAA
jgi:hypothetical protein